MQRPPGWCRDDGPSPILLVGRNKENSRRAAVSIGPLGWPLGGWPHRSSLWIWKMAFLRALIVLALLAPLAVADDVLRTLDNKTITGTLVAVSDKEVSIKT